MNHTGHLLYGQSAFRMLCSATALLGCTASTALAGRLFRLVAFFLILVSIFLDVFFHFLFLLDVLLFILGRCLLSHLGRILVGAPGARSTASTALGCVSGGGDRNTCHKTGNTKTCYETLDLIFVHVLTTFHSRMMQL